MKKYRSTALEILHKTASSHHRQGLIDESVMTEFDVNCLFIPEEFTAQHISALRRRENVSPAIFAACLNVPESFVRDWERGARTPTGPVVRLLSLIKSDGLRAICL